MVVYRSSILSAAPLLLRGGIGVLRTDTLYGVIARADDEAAVEKVYKAKRRSPEKSPIILIASIDHMYDQYDAPTMKHLLHKWPGKNSIIVPSKKAPLWIKRDNASVAYRMPDDAELRSLIKKVGPLIAPSANTEGGPPATTIEEARAYFGDSVDFYIDGGRVTDASPSKLYKLSDHTLERLR